MNFDKMNKAMKRKHGCLKACITFQDKWFLQGSAFHSDISLTSVGIILTSCEHIFWGLILIGYEKMKGSSCPVKFVFKINNAYSHHY